MKKHKILHYQVAISGEFYSIELSGFKFEPMLMMIFTNEKTMTADFTKSVPTIYCSKKEYSDYIDLLRNEKPIFLSIDRANKTYEISTIHEPVGENE